MPKLKMFVTVIEMWKTFTIDDLISNSNTSLQLYIREFIKS